MAQKVKISVRKVLQALFTLVIGTCCLIAMVSASKSESANPIKDFVININNEKLYQFVEKKEIEDDAINNRGIDIYHTPVSKLDIRSMEQVLKNKAWVSDAQLYIDNERILHINVDQRIPIARIFDRDGNSYYMDKTMSIMPVPDSFQYYTTVVTNVPVLGNDGVSLWMKYQIKKVIGTIQAESFWNAQVAQVTVNNDYTFEFLTVLGDQKIVLGDTSRLEEKFANVKAFYVNVLNRVGWDKYKTLDVRFKGQIVASDTLPFNKQVDKGIGELSYIKMLELQRSKNDSIDAIKGEQKEKPQIAKKELRVSEKGKGNKGIIKLQARPGQVVKGKVPAAAEKAKHTDKKEPEHKKIAPTPAKDKNKPKPKDNSKDKGTAKDKSKPKYILSDNNN